MRDSAVSRAPAVVAAISLALAGPAVWAGERLAFGPFGLVLGGEGSFSIAPKDWGYFNEIEYQRNALRLARLALQAELRVGEHVAALTEIRSDNLDPPRAYGLYVRFRPWTRRSFDIQAGLIPTVFGGFTRRPYGGGNALVGYPLAYQYLTTVRPDAVPGSADELAQWRGQGWFVYYPIGSAGYAPGMPLVNTQRWDTGVQVRVGSHPLEVAAALTQGTLSNPRRGDDDNGGKQLSLRAVWKPATGLVIGASGSGGEYLARSVRDVLPPGEAERRYRQWAAGVDAEYSRGHWLVRAEAVASTWDMPRLGTPPVPSPLKALGVMGEGRYRPAPGWSVAARIDHLGFSRIETSQGLVTWDAPVTRVEGVVSYSPLRHATVKAGYQHNWRDGGRVRSTGLALAQLVLWY
jgi:hypothetical protein